MTWFPYHVQQSCDFTCKFLDDNSVLITIFQTTLTV